ncbi:MAG: sigma-70 family RNA polymerase sigma factor [Anaerolineales bacterium]|nr:sigma-70 family RNA polymerase sigma factor [Anaerolineales bacterium]
MDQKTDRELIIELQRGELQALGELYDRHQQMVFRTALGITGDAESAADLLQDTFLRLNRFCSRVDPDRPIQPWLYRVTANLAYTYVKRRSRGFQVLREMGEWLAREFKPGPQAIVEHDEICSVIKEALATLPISQRIVVVLYYVNDLTLQEISEIIEVPVGTVKSRLHYGRLKLKKELGVYSDLIPEVRLGYSA